MKKIIIIPFFIFTSFFLTSFTFVNTSSSYIVLDNNTNRVLTGSNIDTQMLVASTAKILTAITAIENYDLDEQVIITKEDTEEVGSKVYLQENEQISRYDLLCALMLRSANDAASALSQNNSDYFIYLMNETAKKIGMYNSSFSNASGLDELEYNLSTAYDMALLASYASKNETFLTISSLHSKKVTSSRTTYNFINKHKLVYSDEEFCWGKTGYTKKSKRILVSNYVSDEKNVIVVTINDSNDWAHHKSLVNNLDVYDFKTIVEKGIYDTKLDITYYIYIKEDIILPLKEEEYNKTRIVFKLYTDKAMLYIYFQDEVIIKKQIDIYYKNNFNPDILIDFLN